MKQKLKNAFILIAAALFGIIVFQTYWTFNAYQVNKEKFDSNVNVAMQKTMDDCKKDYFDSIRRVLVRRLSPAETTIKIDTIHEEDTVNVQLQIHLSNKSGGMGTPFHTTTPVWYFYQKKINHKATQGEVLVEMSFYVPALMENIKMVLGLADFMNNRPRFDDFLKSHPGQTLDQAIHAIGPVQNSIYQLPPDYRKADSLKLYNYLKKELKKLHISSDFSLVINTASLPPAPLNLHYSETSEVSYKYHGFKIFNIVGPELFIHADFKNPQYGVMKRMMFTILLSLCLIAFVIFCFNYIVKTFIEQKKLSELKDDFINNMTHELKTPIATITVAIEGLQKFNALNDAEKTERYLRTSRDELNRLNNLVTKVLDIAAFENREIGLAREQVDINELINEVMTSEKLKTSKTANIAYYNKDNVRFIFADRIHFRNVVANLIDNSIKYSGAIVNIDITCEKSGNDLLISVKDDGIGIPAANAPLIFDKFHRVPTGNIHNVKGTGLGLSYVKYIVEAHGGSISVKSELDQGSEFIVFLPLADG